MTPFSAALSRTARSFRQAANRIGRRCTRKAEIKFGITVSLPPSLNSPLTTRPTSESPPPTTPRTSPGNPPEPGPGGRSPDRRLAAAIVAD